MTSKLVVNTIEADTGISSVSFGSSISLSSTSKFFFGAAGIDIGADTNINRPASGVLGFNINSDEKVRIDSSGRLGIGTDQFYDGTSKLEVRGRINTVGSASTGSINAGNGTVVNVGSLTPHNLQLMTGNNTRMTFENGTNEALRINSVDKILIGTNAVNGPYDGIQPHILLEGTSYDTTTLTLFCNANSVGASPQLQLGKSRGTSDGSTTIVQNNDRLGSIWIVGADGTDRNSSFAAFDFFVDGAPAANNTPGRIEFKTTSSGSSNPSTKMQLDSNGHLGIAVASATQLANSKQLTLRPTDDDGIRFVRPGDGNNIPNVHLDLTTTTSGSSLRSGGEAYTTKYHGYNCDLLFRSYLGGGTGGIIRLVTSDGSSGTQRFWQMDEKGMTTHRSRSTTVKTHEFSYTGGAGNSTLNVNLLSISGYSASSTAMVEIKYVGMYGLAGAYISQGIWLCSYRRANGGAAANALAQQTHNSGSNSASNVTMAWVGDNLRLTVGAFTGFTVHVTATVYNATINVLV